MNAEGFQENSYSLPGEFFEDEGVRLSDICKALFLDKNYRPMLGLFERSSSISTLPIAVSQNDDVHVVIDCKVKGYFRPALHLTLRAKDGSTHSLKVPMSQLVQGYEGSITDFLIWVKRISGLTSRMPAPNFMYARNIRLKCYAN